MYAIIAAVVAAYSAAPAVQAPQACVSLTEQCVVILSDAIELLAVEVRKREDGDTKQGHHALVNYMSEKQSELTELRQQATKLSLSDAELKQCEQHAYQAFFKALNRLTSIASTYYHRVDTLRLIGDLFR